MILTKMHSNPRHDLRPLLVLAFITLFSLVLRVYELGQNPPGLYNDELYLALSAKAQLNNLHGFIDVPPFNIQDYLWLFVIITLYNLFFLIINRK